MSKGWVLCANDNPGVLYTLLVQFYKVALVEGQQNALVFTGVSQDFAIRDGPVSITRLLAG